MVGFLNLESPLEEEEVVRCCRQRLRKRMAQAFWPPAALCQMQECEEGECCHQRCQEEECCRQRCQEEWEECRQTGPGLFFCPQ